jgi:predicted nuclease with TOPRIM domain
MSDNPILEAIAALGADLRGEIIKTRTEIMARMDRHQGRIDQLAQECFVNYAQGEAVHRRIDNTRAEQTDIRDQLSGLLRQVRALRDRIDGLEGP